MHLARALWLPASWLLASLLILSCASRSAPAPASAPATVASQDGAWVWVQQAGRFASALVDPESGRVIREREGIWVHSGFGLAQLRVREVQSRTFECADVEAGVEPLPLRGTSPTQLLELCPERESGCRTLVPPIPDGAAAELGDQVLVKGTLGPFVFAQRWTEHYGCGAHGAVEASAFVFDLRDGRSFDVLPHVAPAEALRQVAFEELQHRWGAELGAVEIDALTLGAVWPELEEGHMGLRYLFALPSCYACGDAGWGSYTVAHDVRTETLGALLEPYRAIPPGALSYVTQHPGLVFGGATLAAWF